MSFRLNELAQALQKSVPNDSNISIHRSKRRRQDVAMAFQWIYLVQFLFITMISANVSEKYASCRQLKTQLRANNCCPIPVPYRGVDFVECLAKTQAVSDNPVEQYKCVVECIGKKIGLYKNGTIDRVATKKKFRESSGPAAVFEPILGDVIQKCFDNLAVVDERLRNQMAPGTCSTQPLQFYNCLQTELFMNCPAKAWRGGSECDELKKKIKQGCPFVMIAF